MKKIHFIFIILTLLIGGCTKTDAVKTDLDVSLANGKVTQESSDVYTIDSFSIQGVSYSSNYDEKTRMFKTFYSSSNVIFNLTLRKGSYFSLESRKANSETFEFAYTNKEGDVRCILKDKTLCSSTLVVQIEKSILSIHELLNSSVKGKTGKNLVDYGYRLNFTK